MRHLTQRIENLSPAKRALLEQKLRAKVGVQTTTITPRSDRTAAPLTSNQESLWFLEQLNPNTSLYNLSDAKRLRGALHLPALQQAMQAIVARHDSLRTSFCEGEAEPQQIIHDNVSAPLQEVDLSTHIEAEAEALRLLTQAAESPFDLTHGPLVRFTLVRLNAQEHLLQVVMHHIISDGWSIGVFWQEFAQLYEGFVNHHPAQLSALPIQFGDYAAWVRTQKTGGDQLAYWKTQLAGVPSLLELPTDHPRPAVQSFRGAQLMQYLPTRLCHELKALSQREGCTLFMTLLAGFNALLARYTGQEDLVVGTPLAGRNSTETEGLIGFFVNVLALRTDVSDNPTFRELLQKVRATTLDAFSHQDVPFEKVVAELRPERSLSYNPIFQTAFALQTETHTTMSAAGLQISSVKLGSITAKFDLFLSACEVPDGLRLVVEYNTDLFEAATIERWVGHYQHLLTSIVVDPQLRLSDLTLLSAEEQQQIKRWNETATPYPRELSIAQLFEAQVNRTPDAIAMVAGEVQMSYHELNRRANQLAHALRSLGVKPDSLVGIFTDRSLLTVIGALGILKAGGAYLPLDADYPKSRLQFMLEDAQAPVILTQQAMLSKLPETAATILSLDTGSFSQYSADNPDPVTKAEDLAYVIYTSGSTGHPKGVAIPQRAVNRLVFHTNYVQLTPQDVIAQVSNVSFDAATFELWGSLLHGGKLVLINKDIALSPTDFVQQLREQNVTTLFLTTAYFNLLAREVPTAFRTLKTLMFGGEACDPAAVREVLQHGPPERLLHVYGPTESTTFATWHLIEAVPEEAKTIPIGRPLSNTTIAILNRYLTPVPVGIPGELYIGGDGLARGYLHQPELTAEKFTRVQAAGSNAPILYRTGDIARYLPDGSIEFIGRKDHQIKLRGFRIELGEIETALLAHPGVQECVVTLLAARGRDKQLAAYFVPAQSPAPAAGELRTFLQERLPEYMLPALFVPLNVFPLNPNGKVDRQRLPQPQPLPINEVVTTAQPQDELELKLTWLWEKALGVSPIGTQDNFFALGGHSLIAVRLF
ncbi:MAG TPA: amino acid adenylation domain-containing protein, partial [Blastocatellia bacterium]|nr:amino acid adenylation domain-containing protein [Blastocatellia bacterium]